ncbi:MAG: hypothetical protein ACXAE3_01585 [Candidatus Kariarchaeaceae archaeon]|jgi:H+/Cl- antiporter ClcA
MESRSDPFLRIALGFILGVVVGFALVLMGIMLFMVALLSSTVDSTEYPWWAWLLLAIASEIVGVFLMKRTLAGTPTPGTYGPGSKNQN